MRELISRHPWTSSETKGDAQTQPVNCWPAHSKPSVRACQPRHCDSLRDGYPQHSPQSTGGHVQHIHSQRPEKTMIERLNSDGIHPKQNPIDSKNMKQSSGKVIPFENPFPHTKGESINSFKKNITKRAPRA